MKELRLAKNLTQNQVATLLGLHTNERISKWERGTKVPSLSNFLLLSMIYEVHPNDLYPDLLPSLFRLLQDQQVFHQDNKG
ncbi:MAG: helix-turn-helix transcriptional regulator [Bacteroidetes bacterium]|nr:helix-turn-helix transcriptional regulator [Bacteroidota bacterium]